MISKRNGVVPVSNSRAAIVVSVVESDGRGVASGAGDFTSDLSRSPGDVARG
ncbi:hypothetical protein N9A86_05985 [Akkermansiaceae bacterium]|nr:hypothetical protein [Akkermansiaceae bacterium]